jgi:hypothetical protein
MNSYAENADKFNCEDCHFTCCKQSDWDRHVLTRKHQTRTNLNQNYADKTYNCKKCNKSYKARNSLWYHENKCTTSVEHINEGLLNLICEQTKAMAEIRNHNTELLKQNTELVSKTLELCKPINTTINTTNNQTNKFNINVFLNETCKNAINFSDFVNNIQISYEDLENNARLGFVNGISKIFLDNLNQLDISERPIHCTDVKRETMYIKDENIWKKQTSDEKLQKAIQGVSYKSMGKLAKWKQENPDYKDADSEFSQRCLVIQKNTLAGSERGVYYPKVIHALARETVVDK